MKTYSSGAFASALIFALLAMVSIWAQPTKASAQSSAPLVFATVERPPFSQQTKDGLNGFSIDLMRAVGRDVSFKQAGSFQEMLDSVANGAVDGAVANISITSAREAVMDFTQPIFESGLSIMAHSDQNAGSLFNALFSRDLLMAILAAIGALAGVGMLMWLFERRKQPYFDRPASQALFPSFWWALNLVVNGGFEERMPQSRPGRFFAVILVVSSLFIVSIFVAHITAAMTVDAITGNINSLSDLEGKKVATIRGSTASNFLSRRDIAHSNESGLKPLLAGFREGKYEAVVFDGPILAWYVKKGKVQNARLLPRTYKPENYGVALQSDSPLTEQINRALLTLRENGQYNTIYSKYFGTPP